MSIQQTHPGELLASYPEFGLSCLYDDQEDPEELTVFEGEEVGASTTAWLTVDVDDAVALDEVR